MITICCFSRFQLLDCRWQWMTLIHMKTRGELATAHTSAHPKRRIKESKAKTRLTDPSHIGCYSAPTQHHE